jgi:hypothetical protein
MGDEDGSRELPQRSRGAARGGSDRSASSVSPVLSEELRQRIQAAVKAERAEAAANDSQPATELPRQATVSPATSAGLFGPSANGNSGPGKHGAKPSHAPSSKPGRAPKPERAARREPASRAESARSERATKNGTAVPRAPGRAETAGHKSGGHGQTQAPVQPSRRGQPEGSAKAEPRRRRAGARLVALAVVLVVAGSLVTVVALHLSKSSSRNSGVSAIVLQQQEALARHQAASWVAAQVNPDDVVSCDQAMYNALRADGFPVGKLLMLRPTSPAPVNSAVVVVTQEVRDLFGTSIDSAWAPDVLASMGSGTAQVTIRLVAPHGALAYQDEIKAGLAGRQGYGKVLLAISKIQLSDAARQQLISGEVDLRLIVATEALAVAEPIKVLEFGNVGPGASTAIPLRYADLATTDSAADLPSGPYLQAMRTRLEQLNLQYRPASSQTVTLPDGPVFRVAFTAPSPLDSISGTP